MARIYIRYSPDVPYKTIDTGEIAYEQMVRDIELHLTKNGLVPILKPVLGYPRFFELFRLSEKEFSAFRKTFPDLPPRNIN